MHPDLLNNPRFVRYYEQWQQNPTSIVFAPIAEYFIRYQLFGDAIRICLEGLNYHPDLVSGRVVLLKAYFAKRDYEKAKQEALRILRLMPGQSQATMLLHEIEDRLKVVAKVVAKVEGKVNPTTSVSAPAMKRKANLATLTMAKIYMAQGHVNKAKEVYQSVLLRDPQNREALEALARLQ